MTLSGSIARALVQLSFAFAYLGPCFMWHIARLQKCAILSSRIWAISAEETGVVVCPGMAAAIPVPSPPCE